MVPFLDRDQIIKHEQDLLNEIDQLTLEANRRENVILDLTARLQVIAKRASVRCKDVNDLLEKHGLLESEEAGGKS